MFLLLFFNTFQTLAVCSANSNAETKNVFQNHFNAIRRAIVLMEVTKSVAVSNIIRCKRSLSSLLFINTF